MYAPPHLQVFLRIFYLYETIKKFFFHVYGLQQFIVILEKCQGLLRNAATMIGILYIVSFDFNLSADLVLKLEKSKIEKKKTLRLNINL